MIWGYIDPVLPAGDHVPESRDDETMVMGARYALIFKPSHKKVAKMLRPCMALESLSMCHLNIAESVLHRT